MNILFCHELGAGLGHISRDHTLIHHLQALGHEVSLTSAQLTQAVKFFPNVHSRLFPSPVIMKAAPEHSPINFDDMLLGYGYNDTNALFGVITAWKALFTLIKPDKLIYNHSPTALLAARLCNIPTVILGNGFEIPHTRSWSKSFTPWKSPAVTALKTKHDQLNYQIELICTKHHTTPISLDDLYPDSSTMLTISEIDHFGPREGAKYVGMPCMNFEGKNIKWSESAQQRIFVYLKYNHPKLNEVCELLNSTQYEVQFICIGLSEQFSAAYKNINFIKNEINMDELVKNANLTITSGSNTMTTSLMYGTPVIALPQVIEQFLAGSAIEANNLGTVITDYRNPQFKELLTQALQNLKHWEIHATPLRSKYKAITNEMIVQEITAKILH